MVLLGQVLSELDRGMTDAERAERHAKMLRDLFATLAPGGSLVVVEPALRDRTRHLHLVRNAPSPPGLACDAALRAVPPRRAVPDAGMKETDWCHEDLAVDLPPWLAPARARRGGCAGKGSRSATS